MLSVEGHLGSGAVGEDSRVKRDCHLLFGAYRVTSLVRNTTLLGPYSRTLPRVLPWSYRGGLFLMSEVRMQGLGARGCILRCGVWGLGYRVWGSVCTISSLWYMVRVEGLQCIVHNDTVTMCTAKPRSSEMEYTRHSTPDHGLVFW